MKAPSRKILSQLGSPRTYAFAILTLPGFYVAWKFADQLDLVGQVVSIAFPIALGWSFYFITDMSTTKQLKARTDEIKSHLDFSLRSIHESRGLVYASKKSVPGYSQYWNHLASEAETLLFIVGSTNKSWFAKGDEQGRRLSKDISRICGDGGRVAIISLADRDRETMMRSFVSRYLPDMPKECRRYFSYSTVSRLNYGAIINDERLVLMPIPHDSAFREETVVVEISRRDSSEVYNNYLADVERLARNAKQVALVVHDDTR